MIFKKINIFVIFILLIKNFILTLKTKNLKKKKIFKFNYLFFKNTLILIIILFFNNNKKYLFILYLYLFLNLNNIF